MPVGQGGGARNPQDEALVEVGTYGYIPDFGGQGQHGGLGVDDKGVGDGRGRDLIDGDLATVIECCHPIGCAFLCAGDRIGDAIACQSGGIAAGGDVALGIDGDRAIGACHHPRVFIGGGDADVAAAIKCRLTGDIARQGDIAGGAQFVSLACRRAASLDIIDVFFQVGGTVGQGLRLLVGDAARAAQHRITGFELVDASLPADDLL